MTQRDCTRGEKALLVGGVTAVMFGTIPFVTGSYMAAGVAAAGLFILMSISSKAQDAE